MMINHTTEVIITQVTTITTTAITVLQVLTMVGVTVTLLEVLVIAIVLIMLQTVDEDTIKIETPTISTT